MEDKDLVIYDGVCNFCNGAVAFILKRDKTERFIFSPMQSEYAQEVIERYKVDTVGVDTFMLVKNGNVFLWSDAALEISCKSCFLLADFTFVLIAFLDSISYIFI